MDKDYTLLRPRCRTGRGEIVSDIAESLRACTENGADPAILFGAADEIDKLRAENASLKEAISLSEDSRLMDEYLKLERANARQSERIKANEQYEQALGGGW